MTGTVSRLDLLLDGGMDGQFIGQLSVDPAQGGAFGLNIVQATDDVVRFAAVDDNANSITIWKLNTASLTDPDRH